MKPIAFARIPFVLLFAFILTLAPLTVANSAPTAVQTCDEAGLDAALAAGGTNTFSCTTPTTITVSATKIVSVDGTVLDGGGLLTISGGSAQQVFMVNADITATFMNLTIRDGSAANGAGIISLGSLVITGVTFLNNVAIGSGGAIDSIGPALTITGSTFSGNSGTGDLSMGGALFIGSAKTPTITNSTFYNNSANRGGAILTSGTTVALTITASTFSGNIANTAFGASGIFNSNGSVTLQNTIFNTTNDRNCNGAIIDSGNNLQFGGMAKSCGGTIPTGDPKLAAPGNNGGMTPTMALLPGSAAIDKIAVDQCIVTVDQRGYLRPAFGGSSTTCDIGAFEVQQMIFLPWISG